MSNAIEQSEEVAVVTGDIVGYADLKQARRKGLSDELRDIYETVRGDLPNELPCDIAISEGDRWQWLVQPPEVSLGAMVGFFAHLEAREIETRAVIGVGDVDFLAGGNLHEADGTAFRASGRGLEEMAEDRYLQCVMPDQSRRLAQVAADAIAECVDYIVGMWTQAQATAVAGKSSQLYADRRVTNADIGADWSPEPITKQAVGSHLQKAQWPRLERTVGRFRELFAQ